MSKDEKSDSKTVRIEHGKEEPPPPEKPGGDGFRTRTVEKGDDSARVEKEVANKRSEKK